MMIVETRISNRNPVRSLFWFKTNRLGGYVRNVQAHVVPCPSFEHRPRGSLDVEAEGEAAIGTLDAKLALLAHTAAQQARPGSLDDGRINQTVAARHG